MGFVAYHLIQFTGEALRGEHNASFYAAKSRQRAALSAKLPPIGSGVSCEP